MIGDGQDDLPSRKEIVDPPKILVDDPIPLAVIGQTPLRASGAYIHPVNELVVRSLMLP